MASAAPPAYPTIAKVRSERHWLSMLRQPEALTGFDGTSARGTIWFI
jgi:hypothetical protein